MGRKEGKGIKQERRKEITFLLYKNVQTQKLGFLNKNGIKIFLKSIIRNQLI